MRVTNAMRAGFVEALLEELESECEPIIELPGEQAETLFMANCNFVLTRETGNRFRLVIEQKGEKSEVMLSASLDATGAPHMCAHIE